ncbi:hypothetical protein [Pseudarthrobacter albicanus]|uniref:hypothetical protein n=1 Tax=Pseudarthrobacter albicanus TaxID=2823873 RepID=UPI001FE7F915|nr:hypothetical protein [Pseudarthrobacter albicanus]
MARLRRHFDDELLVRTGRAYELTPFAHALVPLVDEAMLHIQRATRIRSSFDASTSEREFVIAASDYAAALIVGRSAGYCGRRLLVSRWTSSRPQGCGASLPSTPRWTCSSALPATGCLNIGARDFKMGEMGEELFHVDSFGCWIFREARL